MKWVMVAAVLLGAACGASDPTGTTTTTTSSATSCTGSDTWTSFGAGFFPGTCGGCHGQFTTHAGVQASAGSAASALSSGRMPPSGLTSTSRQRAIAYLDCGAP